MDQEKSPLFSTYKASKEGREEFIELATDTKPSPLANVRIIYKKNRTLLIIYLGLLLLAVVLLCAICIGVFAGSGHSSAKENITQEICANPPLLLVSLDGFRASYLTRNLTPNLQHIIDTGVRSEYMRSSFPTLTFPNHYSIVTGLYPESHGIVSNNFYDTQLKKKFSIRDSADTKWWGGEPVWVTAIKAKLLAAVYFWPGSEVEIQGIRPTIYFPYNGSTPFNERVDTVLGWLDRSKHSRPQFIALYFNQPDHAGHQHGPDSAEVNASLGDVDGVMGRLWEGLQQRNISDCVNLMIVSDHGMSATNMSKTVHTKNLLSPDLASSPNLSFPSYGPVMNIDVNGGDTLEKQVYQSFVKNGTSQGSPFRVFHTENLPLRLHTGHFNKHRYGAIFAIADDDAYLIPPSKNSTPQRGNHGYDNIEKTLQAIFIAHGPAFKKGYVAEPFENVQLYSLMCNFLDITSATNNGTVGSLRDILDPHVADKFPPAKAPGGNPGVETDCPFPGDNSTLKSRSICVKCVCSENCTLNHTLNHTAILENNRNNFNHTAAQETVYQQQHFPWGVPPGGRGDGACLLSQPDYVNIYSSALRIPLLVGYTLTGEIIDPSVCFRRDPRVEPANSANCSLYNNSTDSQSVKAVSWVLPTNNSMDHGLSTTVFTGVVPLWQSFITDVWNPFGDAISDWLLAYHQLNVMVGSVLDTNRDGLRDPDSTYPRVEGVAVPSHVFVVVTRCGVGDLGLGSCDPGDLEVLGMLFQHPLETGDYLDGRRVLRYALTPLRDIERVTGLDFFPNLSAEQQNHLELRLLDELWPTTSI